MNGMNRVVTGLLVASFLTASSGAFLVWRELGELTTAMRGIESIITDYGERIRYLERVRRGLTPRRELSPEIE